MRNIFNLSVVLPTLTKKLLKFVAIAQELSIDLPFYNRVRIYSALTLLMFMIDLIPDQTFHNILITQKVIL